MKCLITTLLLLGAMISITDAHATNFSGQFLLSSEYLTFTKQIKDASFPDYTCKVSVKLAANFGVGIEGQCEGGGTSKNSPNEACEKAYQALAACTRRATIWGFRRVIPPTTRPLPPKGSSGGW